MQKTLLKTTQGINVQCTQFPNLLALNNPRQVTYSEDQSIWTE